MGKKDKFGKEKQEEKGPLTKALAKITQLEDELCALGSTNGALEAENANLKKENEELKSDVRRFGILSVFLAAIVIALIAILII